MKITNQIQSLFSTFIVQSKLIWLDLKNTDPSNKQKILIAGVCTFTSVWIGIAYSDKIGINGWQFWTWLACVIFIVPLFYSKRPAPSRQDLIIIFSLLAAALLIRLPFLGWVPGFFHVDESGVAEFARDNLLFDPNNIVNPFVTGPGSQPTMFHYIQYFCMRLFGFSIFGARISSAIVGSMGVITTYLMIRSIDGKKVGLLSAIMMASYHFSVQYSRIGLNNIWDTLWVPLVIYGFLKGWKEQWPGGAVIAGMALGLSQYFYHGSKIVIFLLAFLIIKHWKDTDNLSQKVGFLAILAAISLCIAGPIFMFSFANPTAFYSRLNDDWGWRPIALQISIGEVNYWKYFWHQVQYSLGTYVAYPDPSGFYGPGIPLVTGVAGILFILGIIISVIKKNWLPIVWIGLTSLFGGFLLSVPNSSPHYVVAIPAICWLVGLAINWIWEGGHPKIAIMLITAIVIIDLYFYFNIYTYTFPRDYFVPFPPKRF